MKALIKTRFHFFVRKKNVIFYFKTKYNLITINHIHPVEMRCTKLIFSYVAKRHRNFRPYMKLNHENEGKNRTTLSGNSNPINMTDVRVFAAVRSRSYLNGVIRLPRRSLSRNLMKASTARALSIFQDHDKGLEDD